MIVGVQAAKDRALVRLPDGREGRVVYVASTRRAKVLVEGRYVRLSADELTRIEEMS